MRNPMTRWLVCLMGLLIALSGCQRSTTLPRAPLVWKQAILNDAIQPCRMEAQVQIPHADRLPALLEVYRPHPDYLQIVERGAEACLIGGREYRPTTYVTSREWVRWLPLERRCIVRPQLLDAAGKAQIQQLFERNARLREVERAEWQGKQWVVVEAWVPDGYLRKRYWITDGSPPYVGRIQTYNRQGVLIRDEQRFRYQILPAAAAPPAPPAPPPDWRLERPLQIAPLEPKQGFKLGAYQPPKGYERIMVLKRSCPCGGSHFAMGALYSNGLDCFTLFLLPAECPDARRADSQLRLSEGFEGVVATVRRADGKAILLTGEIQPSEAARMLANP